MKKTFAIILLISLLMCLFTGCSNNSQAAATGNAEQAENTPIKIDELEISTDVVNGEPVFWVKNNSAYTISGVYYKKTVNDSGAIIVASAWQKDIAPGETSNVVVFTKDNHDASGKYIGQITALESDLANSTNKTIEFNYYNENGESAWMEYDFTTKTYRGYVYDDLLADLDVDNVDY